MFKILLVEDEAPIRDMVRFALSREGMDMLEAADVTSALTLLDSKLPDLILLDWMLPEESGLVLLRRLRKNRQWRDIPVIMLTARVEEVHKIQGFDAGADDYVTKPFSPKELIARIRAVLRRSDSHDHDGLLKACELVLNPDSHKVTCRGERVEVGPTEFRLLQFFLTHMDRVYSRNQLLDYVWSRDSDVEDRTVDVSVRRLRKALEPHGHDGLIQTVRGAGYRFSATVS